MRDKVGTVVGWLIVGLVFAVVYPFYVVFPEKEKV